MRGLAVSRCVGAGRFAARARSTWSAPQPETHPVSSRARRLQGFVTSARAGADSLKPLSLNPPRPSLLHIGNGLPGPVPAGEAAWTRPRGAAGIAPCPWGARRPGRLLDPTSGICRAFRGAGRAVAPGWNGPGATGGRTASTSTSTTGTRGAPQPGRVRCPTTGPTGAYEVPPRVSHPRGYGRLSPCPVTVLVSKDNRGETVPPGGRGTASGGCYGRLPRERVAGATGGRRRRRTPPPQIRPDTARGARDPLDSGRLRRWSEPQRTTLRLGMWHRKGG